MGCVTSKGTETKQRRDDKKGNVGKIANAFETGKVGEATTRQKEAEKEKEERRKQIKDLQTKSMQEKRKAAEKKVEECFKDKPPTGGGAPPCYRT